MAAIKIVAYVDGGDFFRLINNSYESRVQEIKREKSAEKTTENFEEVY